MSRFASDGGGSTLRQAARNYVRAKGGGRRAAIAASSGRRATARLGAFLSNVAARGFPEAARSLGLETFIGRPAEEVLAALVNALAPDGATLPEVIARHAVNEALIATFEHFQVEIYGMEQLNAMDADGIREAVRISVTGFIYQRWLQELGRKIEEKAVSAREAVRIERDVKMYVNELVKLELHGRDVLQMDWAGQEGQHFTQRIYEEAYGLLGS